MYFGNFYERGIFQVVFLIFIVVFVFCRACGCLLSQFVNATFEM